jgi:hypothetical protein
VADRQLLAAAFVAAGAVGCMWLYANGKTPSVTFDERAVDQTYSPYSHFLHSSPTAWVRHFPERVGANCLPVAIQNQDVGYALRRAVTVDADSCAQ